MAKKTQEATISKAEAVRQALAAGKEIPEEGVAFIKEKFDLEMERNVFSTYKSQEKAKAEKANGKKAEGVVATASNKAGSPTNGSNAVGNGKAADLARTVKQLVEQYGAEEVKGMVGVFGG